MFVGGSQCVSSHSEVVFEIAGNRRSRKRPQSDLTHNGSPHIPKSRGGGFHGRAMGKSTRDPGRRSRAMLIFALEINKKSEGRNPTVLPLETLSFWSLVLKLRELAAGWRVAQGRHLMVPELSSGAPGSPYAAVHF